MKKIGYFMISCALLLMAACSSNAPTGDGEKDAKEFSKQLLKNFHAKDVEELSKTIDLYYNFYKDKSGQAEFNLFFKVFKTEVETMFKDLDEENEFGEMVEKADQFGKMEMLYRLYMKNQ